MFANRLRKNQRHLARWARREGVTCYRVYDADLPEYAVAIDRYEEWVHVQEYQAPKTIDPERAAARLADVVAVVPAVLGGRPRAGRGQGAQPSTGQRAVPSPGEGGRWSRCRKGGYGSWST